MKKKSPFNLRLRALLATVMILIVLEPFASPARVNADSFAAVFAYNPTTIQQEVSVTNINTTSQFKMTISVSKSWANDDVYIEAVFKDSSGTALSSVRNPASGSTTLTSDTPIEMSVTLASTDAAWSNSIAKVEVIVWGDDGEYWAGNYGMAVDWVKLEQTTTSGTTQLLLNPEFANGDSNWTSSAGWQACSGGGGGAVCITNSYAPPTTAPPITTTVATTTPTTPTTTAPIATTSTSSTTSTVAPTTSTVAAATTTVPIPTTSSTTQAPVGQAAVPRVSTTVAGNSTTSSSSTSTTSTTTTTTTIPRSPELDPGETALSVDGEAVATTLERKNNQLIISSERMNAVISGRHADGSPAVLDNDGNIRLETGDQLLTEVSGFNPDSDVDVWIFSEPTKLGSAKVASTGKATSALTLPTSIKPGQHGVVVSGVNPLGEKAEFSVGIIIGSDGGVGTIGKILIAVPVLLAGFAALTIPARRKRRNSGLRV